MVCVSGGFDPLHIGHISYIQEARKILYNENHGKLCVIVNGDEFLKRKKGYFLLHAEERAKIIDSLVGVDFTVIWNDTTDHVAECLRLIRPDTFANGGDRSDVKSWHPEEIHVCMNHGIRMIGGIGGADKTNSSSEIFKKAVAMYMAHNS